MDVQAEFEEELRSRRIAFSIDAESGRHAIEIGGAHLLVSLENVRRDVTRSGDRGRITRFVDSIVASASAEIDTPGVDRLYWCLEPSDYEERADFRVPVSDCVDRVLVHLSADGNLISWLTPELLEQLGLSESEAANRALENLATALSDATVESQDIDGVALGYLTSRLPFKSSLMLAPNLRSVVEAVLGWPLLAVAPDRDFLYLWGARHTDFTQRVGNVVVREYQQASYPISTEVFRIADDGIQAIGEFPTS
jgi:hypothetical protein